MSDYDAVPYHSSPVPATHPERLATVGRLLGIDTPLPSRARVLEIGCSTGGNLIPMAALYPDASFVGMDLSPVQIELAHEEAAPLSLPNLELRQGDLSDIDASWGDFDYVIAHGVWSWVPHEVQERLFAVCSERLTPNGVAYVSHNVYPGWRVREILRELMLLHAEGAGDPAERIARAREAAALLARVYGEGSRDPSKVALQRQATAIEDHRDAYLLHEYLAPCNTPVWFRDFARRAKEHGLAFLADARFPQSLPMHLPPEAQAFLAGVGDIVALEQYSDFFKVRAFRCTLLVRADVPIDRGVDWRGAQPLHFSCHGVLETQGVPLSAREPATLRQHEDELTTDSPVTKAALQILAERWPESLPFEALLAAARDRYGAHSDVDGDRHALGQLLLLGYANGLVLPRREPSRAVRVGPRPEVFRVALRQVRQEREYLTTTRHRRVTVEPEQARILALLDGTRTRQDLLAAGYEPQHIDATLQSAEYHAILVG